MITVYPDNGVNSSGLLAPPKYRTAGAYTNGLISIAGMTDIGAVTANTYKTALTITGKGVLESCNMGSADSKSIQGQIIVDGYTVIDTGVVLFSSGTGCSLFASVSFPIAFNTSLLVQLKPSVTQSSGTVFSSTYRVS